MLVWEDNASSSTLPDGADSRVQVISPFATMEDDRKLAVDTTVPDVEESWDSLRQAVFMPGTPLPTLQYLASAFFAESSEIVFLATGVVLKGPAAILELFKQTAASSYGVDALQNEIISQVSGTDVVSGRRTMVETVIFGLVHDQPISWLLPDVKPTRKRIVLPMDINVAFGTDGQTGRKVVTSVRVFFDLGSVMRQIGLLPQSLYCKANSSETTLPVVGVRVADPLTVNRKPSPTDEEERPAGPRSHIVSPQKMKESRVFSAPADEPIRTSTRIFQKPTSDVFSDKTEPLRTSVPIDPRRYETHVNVFNPNETPVEEGEKPGKRLVAVNPNLTSHMATLGISAPPPDQDADTFKPTRKLVGDPTSRISPDEREETFKPQKKLFMDQANKQAPSADEAFHPSLKQFGLRNKNQINISGPTEEEIAAQQAAEVRKPRRNESQITLWGAPGNLTPNGSTPERPSSRVLRPPGGGSTLTLS